MGVSSSSQAYHQLPLPGVVHCLPRHPISLPGTHPLHCLWLWAFSSGARPAVARVRLCVRSTLERGEQWAALCLPFWQDIYLKGKSNQSGRRAADCKPRRRLSKGRLRWLFIRCRAPFSRVQTIYIFQNKYTPRQMSLHTHQNLWQNASRLLRRPRSSSLIWLKQGAQPNTNKAELFWFRSTVVMSFLVSAPAQLSCCRQQYDNNLREVLKDLHSARETHTHK